MIIIALKGAIRVFFFFFFFTISSLCRELYPTRTLKWSWRNRVQITSNTSSAYHVKLAVRHFERGDSSALKFDRVEIAFFLALFYWLKQLMDEGGEETGVVTKTPNDVFQKYPKLQAHARLEPAL